MACRAPSSSQMAAWEPRDQAQGQVLALRIQYPPAHVLWHAEQMAGGDVKPVTSTTDVMQSKQMASLEPTVDSARVSTSRASHREQLAM
jgi:hypothetical protein